MPGDTARLAGQAKTYTHHPSCVLKGSVCEPSKNQSSRFWQLTPKVLRVKEHSSEKWTINELGYSVTQLKSILCTRHSKWHLGTRWKTFLLVLNSKQQPLIKASFLLPSPSLQDEQFLLCLTWHTELTVKWSLLFSVPLMHSNVLCQQQLFDKVPKGLKTTDSVHANRREVSLFLQPCTHQKGQWHVLKEIGLILWFSRRIGALTQTAFTKPPCGCDTGTTWAHISTYSLQPS